MFVVNERVFIDDTSKMFATVTRTGMCNITQSVIMMRDDAKLVAVGDCCDDLPLVHVDTGMDGQDVMHTVPVDVKMVGPDVLTARAITPIRQTEYFQRFVYTPVETRLSYGEQWEASLSDPNSTFVEDLLVTLGDDDTFITGVILSEFDGTVNTSMSTTLMSTTTENDRTNLIVNYSITKNYKKEHELFMQNNIYQPLMDNDTYLEFEMKRFGIKIYDEPTLLNKINLFFADKTTEEKTSIIQKWIERRMFTDKRFGPLFIRSLLKMY